MSKILNLLNKFCLLLKYPKRRVSLLKDFIAGGNSAELAFALLIVWILISFFLLQIRFSIHMQFLYTPRRPRTFNLLYIGLLKKNLGCQKVNIFSNFFFFFVLLATHDEICLLVRAFVKNYSPKLIFKND